MVNDHGNGKIDFDLNTASNFKNTLVHEFQHEKDKTKRSYSTAKKERRAIKTQKAHPTYKTTTESYQKLVDRYEKKYSK